MSAAAAAPANEDRLIEEMITELGGELEQKKPAAPAAPAKPKSAPAAKYEVFKTLAALADGSAPAKAPSVDALLASYGGGADVDVASLHVSFVKPYGTAFLVKPANPPSSSVLKKLSKALGRETPLTSAAAPKDADYAVMLKPGKRIVKTGEKTKASKKVKAEKQPESVESAVRKRIKGNLDKLKEKEKKAGGKKKAAPVTTA